MSLPDTTGPKIKPQTVVSSVLSGMTIAIDASMVESIVAKSSLDDGDHVLDLASILKIQASSSASMRHGLSVKSLSGYLTVFIGESMQVEDLPPDSLHPLPQYLGELAKRSGICWVFSTKDRQGYVVDIELIMTSRAQEGQR